jgi:hypothetical protein
VARNIIQYHPPRYASKKGHGPLVQAKPGVDFLITDNFSVLVSAVSQGGYKYIAFPHLPGFRVVDRSDAAKIYLQLFPGLGMDPYKGFFLGRLHAVHKPPHR